MPRRIFEYKDNYYTLTELAAMGGHTYASLKSRLDKGWDIETAVETPPDVVLPPQEYHTCESGAQFFISISQPIPSVFKEMQPKLHKVYQASIRGGEYRKNDRPKRFFIINLDDGRPLIVYPEECSLIQRCRSAS